MKWRRARPRPENGRPLRVAQMCGTTDGAYWMVQISAGLVRRGYEVVAFIGGDGGTTAANCRRLGIPYVVMPPNTLASTSRVAGFIRTMPGLRWLRWVVDAWAILHTAAQIAWQLRRERIDVVYSHTFTSIIFGRLAGTLARIRVRIAMVPGPYHLESPHLRRIDLATCRLDHKLVAGSRTVEALYADAGIDATRRTCVSYGADPAEFDPALADGARVRAEYGLDAHTPVIGQVAYFYPVFDSPATPPALHGRGLKGHEDVVAAAKIVLEQRPDVRFMLVGGGFGEGGESHRDDVRRLCVELGIDHAVIFTGHRSDVPDVLAAFDVSLQPSLSENYGGTLESLLMARPTIATRVGGMPEVVRHEQTGLLVPPRHPEALADAMLRLIDDPELGRRLAEAGRQRVLDGYTVEHMIDGVARVIGETAAQRIGVAA